MAKLFEKRIDGTSDANFSFDDLVTLVMKLGYDSHRTKGSCIIFQRGWSFLACSRLLRAGRNVTRFAKCGKN